MGWTWLQVSRFKLEYEYLYVKWFSTKCESLLVIPDRFESRTEPRSDVLAKDGSQGSINVDSDTIWTLCSTADTNITTLVAFWVNALQSLDSTWLVSAQASENPSPRSGSRSCTHSVMVESTLLCLSF